MDKLNNNSILRKPFPIWLASILVSGFVLSQAVSAQSNAQVVPAASTPSAAPTAAAPTGVTKPPVLMPAAEPSPKLTQVPVFNSQAPKANMDPNADLLLQYGTEASVYRALTKKLEAQLQAITRQSEVEKAAPGLKRKPGPVLVAVEGLKSKGLIAVIEIIPGAAIEAREGTQLPDGSVVQKINFDSVVLKSKRGARSVVLNVPQFNVGVGSTAVGRFMTSADIKAALPEETLAPVDTKR
jgi:hypothetical protein